MSLAELFGAMETLRSQLRTIRQARRLRRTRPIHWEALEPRMLLSAAPMETALPAIESVMEPSAVSVPQGALPNLDVDLNGTADALTDGVLVMRHLFGFTGSALTAGAVDPAGQRREAADITSYLNAMGSSMLDVDADGSMSALSDGVLVLRGLMGFTGPSLIIGAVNSLGSRTDADAIAAFLNDMAPQRETNGPIVFAGLEQDTGGSHTDTITSNATVIGIVSDLNAIASFRVGFDDTPPSGFTDVLAELQTSGGFTLSQTRLAQVAGGTLRDGARTLHLEITDIRGNVTLRDVSFILDTKAPRTPTFTIHPAHDTGLVGDQQTTLGSLTLLGLTEIGVTVRLGFDGPTLIAEPNTRFDSAGRFEFPGQAMVLGQNLFTVTATDLAGNASFFTNQLTRVAAESFDVVVEWNAAHLRAIALAQTPPPYAARNLAIVQAAVFDAVNGIEQIYEAYRTTAQAPSGASAVAAAVSAAHRSLSALYPLQSSTFDALFASTLSPMPNGQAKSDGVAWGQAVADGMLLSRSNDGSGTFVNYTPGTDPGEWQLTPPGFEAPLLTQWPGVTPFTMASGDQYRPAGPPPLQGHTYASEFNEVQAYGRRDSAVRTAEQTEIARFWADGSRTFTPPGHWNQIAAQFAIQPGRTLLENARLFAMLDLALADAGIASWDAKYAFNFWRPVTAIHQADLDGNQATIQDTTWTSLLTTPPFPEYTSGHSTFSGAASRVLEELLGSVVFSTMSLGLPGVYRSFQGFAEAADEAGQSRIYGGIHFQSANRDGLAAGRALGSDVVSGRLQRRSSGAEAELAPTTDASTLGSSLAFVQAAWVSDFLQTSDRQETDDETVSIS